MEYRVDKHGNLHIPLGKASFSVDDLYANLKAVQVRKLNLNRAKRMVLDFGGCKSTRWYKRRLLEILFHLFDDGSCIET